MPVLSNGVVKNLRHSLAPSGCFPFCCVLLAGISPTTQTIGSQNKEISLPYSAAPPGTPPSPRRGYRPRRRSGCALAPGRPIRLRALRTSVAGARPPADQGRGRNTMSAKEQRTNGTSREPKTINVATVIAREPIPRAYSVRALIPDALTPGTATAIPQNSSVLTNLSFASG